MGCRFDVSGIPETSKYSKGGSLSVARGEAAVVQAACSGVALEARSETGKGVIGI